MNKYENMRHLDMRDIAKSQGLRLWSQLRKDEMIPYMIENENIDKTQCEEKIREQRSEIDKRHREKMKQKRREEFERRYPKNDMVDRDPKVQENIRINSERQHLSVEELNRLAREHREKLRVEEERERRERSKFWQEEFKRIDEQIMEEREFYRSFREAGWTIGRLGGRRGFS